MNAIRKNLNDSSCPNQSINQSLNPADIDRLCIRRISCVFIFSHNISMCKRNFACMHGFVECLHGYRLGIRILNSPQETALVNFPLVLRSQVATRSLTTNLTALAIAAWNGDAKRTRDGSQNQPEISRCS